MKKLKKKFKLKNLKIYFLLILLKCYLINFTEMKILLYKFILLKHLFYLKAKKLIFKHSSNIGYFLVHY